ncbi:signal recognition particle-docking protein FtsY [Mangrovihabitans endophyticus]|uniref:Signal recognition particle receptor FtsY n=1 Tax=Mangrovihabitans endophyticus TaxID=1751298 RepID=A0A8J3FN43_9ACTN|nr:signal recognition particle-docking protein FtsY [Mangrovihabitans endophyticus]GGK89601.1 signal recognition particle receptor FtsY [Mangrovihabitans endophyticus]
MEYVVVAVVLLVILVAGAVGLVVPRMRRRAAPPTAGTGTEEGTGTEAGTGTATVEPPSTELPTLPDDLPPLVVEEKPAVEQPEPTAGRLVRLRARLSRSQSVFGRGLLSVLSRDHLDEDAWEEIEDSLITADVGIEATQVIVERLRERVRVLGTRTVAEVREQLAEELTAALDPELDRSLHTAPHDGRPAVLLVVGVNGAGKTTTCGKVGRVLIADGRSVLFGAADTFRAAAADQLTTWGDRVGAQTVRGPEGGDPASVAFDAVKKGIDDRVDTVLIDTAGRLQNKVGLMDELGKVKRVVEKHGPVDETLLVLDATTGQNGLEQARVFTEVVDVTGVVLTKLDGTAKGGIVIAVQRKLGIPVKLVGLGEGPDDLAPFEPAAFVEALLGGDA